MAVLNLRVSLTDRNTFFFIAISVALSALVLRGGTNFISPSLWAEDGNVFINQAAQLGLSSVWTPYAGYLHLYPRLISLAALNLPLQIVPYFFWAAWCLAFFIMHYILISRSRMVGISALVSVLLIAAITLQPHSGEVFFNLTNAQWFMGVALAVFLCVPKAKASGFPALLLLILASLTGPFSLLMMPVLVFQLLFLRDFNIRKWDYIVVSLCAALQLIFLLTSPRVVNGFSFDHDASHWFKAVLRFFDFGGANTFVIASAAVFWFIILVAIVKICFDYKNEHSQDSIIPFFSVCITVIVMFAAGLISCRETPLALTPLGWGARYYVIPYSLLFLASFFLVRKRIFMSVTLISMTGFICLGSLSNTIVYADLQWSAFAKFSGAKPGVNIPINPQWATYPCWYVYIPKAIDIPASTILPISVNLDQFVIENAKVQKAGDGIVLLPTNGDPQIHLDLGIMCNDDQDLGLEVISERSEPGWAQVFWARKGVYSESNSIKRYYPAGDEIMRFAFHREIEETSLRIDPVDNDGRVQIKSINMYCLNGVNK